MCMLLNRHWLDAMLVRLSVGLQRLLEMTMDSNPTTEGCLEKSMCTPRRLTESRTIATHRTMHPVLLENEQHTWKPEMVPRAGFSKI